MAKLPVRLRVTLAFAGVMAILLGAAGLALYAGLGAELDATIDQSLRSRTAELLPAARRGEPIPAGNEEGFARVLAPGAALPDFGEPVRVVRTRLDSDRVLAVGQAIDDRNDAMRSLALLLLIGGPVDARARLRGRLRRRGRGAAPRRADAAPGRGGDRPQRAPPCRPGRRRDRPARHDAQRDARSHRDGVRARARVRRPTPATSCARRSRSSRPSSSWHCARGAASRSWRRRCARPPRRPTGSWRSPRTCSCSRAWTRGGCRCGRSRCRRRRRARALRPSRRPRRRA